MKPSHIYFRSIPLDFEITIISLPNGGKILQATSVNCGGSYWFCFGSSLPLKVDEPTDSYQNIKPTSMPME
jgi:hypothetical protein